MFARQIRTATLALAVLAATALPTAQLAAAASGPDLEVTIGPDYKISRNPGDGGGAFIYASIKNVGDAKSVATVMQKFCGYLPAPDGGRLVQWYAVDIMHPSVPALSPNEGSPNTDFYCPVSNGRVPVAARIIAAASQGETNLANNKSTIWIFKLNP